MTDETREFFNTFVRVRDFGVTNTTDFPRDSKGDLNFKIFIAKIPIVEASGALQESNIGKETTLSKEIAAALLRQYLRKINRTARSAGVDHPELAELFRMPHGNNYQKLSAAAMAFHTNSSEHNDELIDFGMPADFRTVLLNRINALQSATTEQNLAKDSKVGATANIEAEINEMYKALLRLRGIVPNVYEDNPAKLAEWASASHIKRAPEKKEEPTPPTT
ncbi:hypothetical protein BH10ACI1_BH10ACI1_11020 [soil metagenome]